MKNSTRFFKITFFSILLSTFILSCSPKINKMHSSEMQANKLTKAEKEAGWILLFDGKTSNGWRAYKKDYFPNGWSAKNGVIQCLASGNAGGATEGGDIIFDKKFQNFHLALEWKISKGGNSGIFYLGQEELDYIWKTAPEMQVLDNVNFHEGNVKDVHKAGALYDLIVANPQNVKPFGEWNKIEIIVNNGNVIHKMNGKAVVEYNLWTPEWNAMVTNSKFPELNPDWAKVAKSGYIGLQDHGDDVWYRNIKIKELK